MINSTALAILVVAVVLGCLVVRTELRIDRALGELERQQRDSGEQQPQQPQGAVRRSLQPAQPCRDLAALQTATALVNVECCDEPIEDCSSGVPTTCNAGCAAVFLAFWRDCAGALAKSGGTARFESVAVRCERESTGLSVAVGAGGNGNAYPFPFPAANPGSLYERYVAKTKGSFGYYPLPIVSDLDMAGEWRDGHGQWSHGAFVGVPRGGNIDAGSSLSAAHYYNAVVYILLRYFDFQPPANGDLTQPWIPPRNLQICQPP